MASKTSTHNRYSHPLPQRTLTEMRRLRRNERARMQRADRSASQRERDRNARRERVHRHRQNVEAVPSVTLEDAGYGGVVEGSALLPDTAFHDQCDYGRLEESKQEEDDPDYVIARTLAREEVRRADGERLWHAAPPAQDENAAPNGLPVQASGRHQLSTHEETDEDVALRAHVEDLRRLHYRDEARAQVQAEEEAASEQRRIRRGKVRYLFALRNHEDFDVSAVSGEDVFAGRRFHLRLLLCHKPGPASFEDLRTVDGVICATFKEAAMRSGYLDDDREWMKCLEEAAVFQMPSQLRQLFATILLYAFPADVAELWNTFYVDLSMDHARRYRELPITADKTKFETLISLHHLLAAGGKTLADYPDLPQMSAFPGMVLASMIDNNIIRRETESYDRKELQQLVDTVDGLNDSQRSINDQVLAAVENVENGQVGEKLFFIDGPGTTGKSTLLNHVLEKVRLDRKIAIAVASSGIASLLLPGGRTAHSTFKLHLNTSHSSVGKIPKQSKLKEFIESASLIVWDEAPMTHRYAFEAVDRTLQEILDNNEPFGGKVVVLSGDFRQILPVVVKGTPSDTVYACL